MVKDRSYKAYLYILLCSIAYLIFAYGLQRTEYLKLISLYTVLFIFGYQLIQTAKDNIRLLTWSAFIFRALFILSIPNLSQDFYRFIWDGRLILEGFNPYLYTPQSFIESNNFPVAQAQELYEGMGLLNGSHFTNYPPLNQLCFVIAGIFSGKSILGSVVVMRLIIIAADIGTMYFGKKLLHSLKLPAYYIFWYILNPFIIIELTGNLHFESVMIFFLIWSIYLLHSGRWLWAAVILALSVSVKLIPLIFLPLFYQWFMKQEAGTNAKLSRLLSFYLIIGLVTILLFAPFFNAAFVANYAETVGLWFRNFEFNASIYYIAREIGYLFRGYNEIAVIGKAIPVVVIIITLLITFFRNNRSTRQLVTAMLLVLSSYYFLSTTVHPWYIATLLALSVFTKYRFPMVWSFVIILSYLAYLNINKADKSENLWIIALEYMAVYGALIWEVLIKPAGKTGLPLNSK